MTDFQDLTFGGEQGPRADFRTLGETGLYQSNGFLLPKPWDRRLHGLRAANIYEEMATTDASCGALVHIVVSTIRSVDWFVREHSDDPDDVAAARFVESCMQDMDHTFEDFIGAAMTSLFTQGNALHELCYKKREGASPSVDGQPASKFADNKIGWSQLPLRSTPTLFKWEFADLDGHIKGVWQQGPPDYRETFIPETKFVNFVSPGVGDGNPTGQSMFKRAVKSYQRRIQLEAIEAIAIERDTCGLPVMWVPPELLNTNKAADPTGALAARRDELKKLVTNIRTDEEGGLLLPMTYDGDNPQFKLELLSSSGSRSIDVGAVIARYDSQIFRTILADFMVLGTNVGSTGGSYALHDSKVQSWLLSLKMYLSIISDSLNRVAVPRLLRLNGMAVKGYPAIDHTPLEQVDAQQLCTAIQALSSSGAELWPNDEILRRVLEIMGLPAPATDRPGLPPKTALDATDEVPDEIYPGDTLDAWGNVVPGPGRQARPTKPGERPAPAAMVDKDAQAAKPRPRPFNRLG